MKDINKAIQYCINNPKKRRISSGICDACGDIFWTPNPTNRCSPACRLKNGKFILCRTCNKSYWIGKHDYHPFCSRNCWRQHNKGPTHPQWKGGKTLNHGYVLIRVNNKGMMEHRYIMSQILGRPLHKFENVHHINGVKTDNRPANLELWTRPQPYGQRITDLISFVIKYYSKELHVALAASLGGKNITPQS